MVVIGREQEPAWTVYSSGPGAKRALRMALRMSLRVFAEHLGISHRTVSKWEAGGAELIPVPDSQALLDTVLERAGGDVARRFRQILDGGVDDASVSSGSLILIPPAEPGLIDRDNDFETLIASLTAAWDSTENHPVAVCGPGGFGKTTLATQTCHDPRVQELFPQILWVETGEDCTPARIVELISDVCVHLEGVRPALTDPEQAGFHLARVLGDRRVLLVIDNVWSAADLAPFLLGGARCVRLVTTRNLRVCPTGTQVLRLGPMSPHEISELLSRAIASLPRADAVRLAELCGGWPLLATIVGANVSNDVSSGAPMGRAASDAGESLRIYGPRAFDVWDADQRHSAIGHAIMASLRSLDEHVTISGGTGLRERYLSLAAFPPSVPVPIDVLTQWWRHASGWSRTSVRQFCRILADRSLIGSYQADRDAIVLHDVFRSYLRNEIGDGWSELHRSLVDAYRPGGEWSSLGPEHSYMWRYLSYHLHEAALDPELVALLASPRYIVNKAAYVGHQSLAADQEALRAATVSTGHVGFDRDLHASAVAMTDAGYLLRDLNEPADLATTLLVASMRQEALDTTVDELRMIASEAASPVVPTWARRLTDQTATGGHVGAVVSVSVSGELVASGGEDGVVRLWDRERTALIRECRGHAGWVYATALTRDGTLLATAGDDAVIRLWRVPEGRLVGLLLGHTRRIRSLAFDDAGSILVSGAEDGNAYVWDVHRRSLLRAMETSGTPIWSVAIGCGDSIVAVSGEDEFVRVFDLESGTLRDEKATHHDWVRAVAFAPDVPLLASASGDRSVRLWNVAGGRLTAVREIATPAARPRSVVQSDRGDLTLVADEDAKVRAFTATGLAGEVKMPMGVDWVRSLACTGDGGVVIGCEDGGLRQWLGPESRDVTELGSGANTVWSTAFADAAASRSSATATGRSISAPRALARSSVARPPAGDGSGPRHLEAVYSLRAAETGRFSFFVLMTTNGGSS
ncbi:NB-ARC domain-containing protein [Catenulispora yoronensis]